MTDEEIFEAIRARVQEGSLVDSEFQPDLAPAASEDDLRAAERVIGFALPPLLRRLYGGIANGGFGPSLGVEGLYRAGAAATAGWPMMIAECSPCTGRTVVAASTRRATTAPARGAVLP